MAMYDMSKEVREIAEITGKPEELVAEELEIKSVGGEWTAWNRREEGKVKNLLAEVKAEVKKAAFRAAKQGDSSAYKEPFFTKGNDGEWVVVARGVDFVEGMSGATIVRVRKRDGSISVVEVIETVDKTNTQVQTWNIQ